jgi:hypothetical protein
MSEKLTQDMIDEVTHGFGNLMRDSSIESDQDFSLGGISRPAADMKQIAEDRSDCAGSSCRVNTLGAGDFVNNESFESNSSSTKEYLSLNRPRAGGDGASTCSLNVSQELQKLWEDIEQEGTGLNGTAELEHILQNFTFLKHRIHVTSPDHPHIENKSDDEAGSDFDATIATSSSGSYHSCEEGAENGVDLQGSRSSRRGGCDREAKETRVRSRLNETFTLDSEGNIIDTSSSGLQENKSIQVELPEARPMKSSSGFCIPCTTFSTVPQVVTEGTIFPKVSRYSSPLSGQFDDVDSLLSEDISLLSSDRSSGRSSLSDSTIIYEYQYTDIEDGHELIERHFVPRSVTTSPDTTICSCNSGDSVPSVASSLPSVASSVRKLDNHQVHQMLQNLGDVPGPVTESTRLLYLRRLTRLKKDPSVPRRVVRPTCSGILFYFFNV